VSKKVLGHQDSVKNNVLSQLSELFSLKIYFPLQHTNEQNKVNTSAKLYLFLIIL